MKEAAPAEAFVSRAFGSHGGLDDFEEFVPTVVSLALFDGKYKYAAILPYAYDECPHLHFVAAG